MSGPAITSRQLGIFAFSALGLALAFLAGRFVVDEKYFLVLIIFAVLVAGVLFFGVGKSLYLLIPIFWGMTGSITLLQIPLSVREFVISLASIIFICGKIFKENELKARYEFIDLWIWINIGWLTIAFFRNPVGMAFFGGDRVGGRPYLAVFLALMAYVILSRFRISAKTARLLPLWIIACSFFTMVAGAISLYLPDIGLTLGLFYSDFIPADFMANVDIGNDNSEVFAGESRLVFLAPFGSAIILYIVAKTNPTKLINPNKWGQLFAYLSGLGMILFSGFRNAVFSSFLVTAVAVILREKSAGFIKVLIGSIFILSACVLLSYSPLPLPFSVQRAFSFLPGHWDELAVADAKGSSEWRFEMWKMVLTSDKYIHNKMLGDGFGFLRSDYEIMMDAAAGIGTGFEGGAQQEAFMINGDFHSGPVSTIRFVGYVGLALFLPLLFITAAYAYKIIKRANGTPFQFCSLFFGIPMIITPFFFIFVFGDYRSGLCDALFNVGVLKMISSSLSDSLARNDLEKV